MAENEANSVTRSRERGIKNVHLFNCDRTYKFDAIRKLLEDVEEMSEYKFAVTEHYFPLPKMAETCAQIADYKMDFAVFVVHANESRLSLNEQRAGIGYAKIYQALLRATGGRVLIVIGGDDNYKGEENSQVLSRWAKMKISSQFSPEYLDGRKSFIFSWEKQHRYIHKDALLHFLEGAKQGQIFVPKPRPLPADLGLTDGAQAQAAQEQAAQEQAIQAQAAQSQLSYPTAAPKLKTAETAKQEREKHFPVSGSRLEATKPDFRKEKPRSHSNPSTYGAGSDLPSDGWCPNQTHNTGQRQNLIAQTNTPKVTPHTPLAEPSHSRSSSRESHRSASVKVRGEEGTKEHTPAPQGWREYQTVEKRKAKVPLTPVNVAIIRCDVLDRSVQVAHAFFHEVAKSLNLEPSFCCISGKDPDELVKSLINKCKRQSFSFVVLLVEKKTLDQIWAGKEAILSYTDLMEETQANAETQAILIVCNDQDTIVRDELQSQSVDNFLGQVGQVKGVTIDPDHWVTLSWNEYDPNFTTKDYETYLVRLVQMVEAGIEEVPRARGTEPTGRQYDSSATGGRPSLPTPSPPPANQGGIHMGQGLSDSPSVMPAAAQAVSPQNPVYKGNILWEGTLEYGRVKLDTYLRPGWQPPQSLYDLLFNDNAATSYTEFKATQDADGSISIFVDSNLRRLGKATWRFTKRLFKGNSGETYYY